MVDVLSDQVADVVALAVRSGDGVTGIVQVDAAHVVGHDLFGEVLVQGQQQALGHAVLFHVNRAADDDVFHVLGGGEHQVQLGAPNVVADHAEFNIHAGLLFDLLEVPHLVEVSSALIVQGPLNGGQLDLLLGKSDAGEQHHSDQNQGNDFLHRLGSPFNY